MKRKILMTMFTLMLCFTAMFALVGCEEGTKLTVRSGGENGAAVTGTQQFTQGSTMDAAIGAWTVTYTGDNYYIEKNPDKAPAGESYNKELGGWKVTIENTTGTVADLVAAGVLRVDGFTTSSATAENQTRKLILTMHGASWSIDYIVNAKA